MRAGRLISIVLLLQNNGRLTSRELAEQLEVSERTILRDMESLSEAGIPVYAERGQQGGWLLSEGYRTNLTGLHADELVSVIAGSDAGWLGDLGIAKHFDAAVQKLLAASPAEVSRSAALARQKLHVDGAGWHQANDSLPLLSIVQEAVWDERKLRIVYRREQESVSRIVHPLGLIAKRSVWYLAAESEGELRTYRISRFIDAVRLEESFDRPENFDLARYWEHSVESFKERLPQYPVRMKHLASIQERLSRERYVKLVECEPEPGGWATSIAIFETLESACEIVLSYGPRIQVLEPEELREKVKKEAREAAQLYE